MVRVRFGVMAAVPPGMHIMWARVMMMIIPVTRSDYDDWWWQRRKRWCYKYR